MTGVRFSLQEQAFFFKRLAFLMQAHVPLPEALTMLESQTNKGGRKKLLQKIIAEVSGGKSFSKSLESHAKMFGAFSISIIKVGEETGSLAKNLAYLAEELTKKEALRRKVIGACVYPAVITFATVGITAFLMLYLFPKIMPIFTSLHTTLPLSTRIVMATSTFVMHWGVLSVGVIIILCVACAIFVQRNSAAKTVWTTLVLHIPLFGSMFQLYAIANACRMFGLLLASGVQLERAALIVADATPNIIYKKECLVLADYLKKGTNSSAYFLSQPKIFPPLMSNMVAVGERSGTLSETFLYLAEHYDAEVDGFTKNLSTLIEPVLMIGMGVVVGFIAVSIITPIYGITQSLHA